MPDILLTPDGYTITEKELAESAVTLVFTPEGDARVYVRTGLSPADVLELVLGFAHRTVSQHFGTYTPDKLETPGPGTVIEG